MRSLILPALALALLPFTARADETGAFPWSPKDPSLHFFLEPQVAYARLDKTDRDFGGVLLDGGVIFPTGEWLAHDFRIGVGILGQGSNERYPNGDKYTRGTNLFPVTAGYTLHVALPGQFASVYAGPRVGYVFADVYESEVTGWDCWTGMATGDSWDDYEALFTYGADAGIEIPVGSRLSIDIGYSYRHIDGADFLVRGRGEVWAPQGLHMIRVGLTVTF